MSWWAAVFPERDAGAVSTTVGMFALATFVFGVDRITGVPLHLVTGTVLLPWSVARLSVVARRIEPADEIERRSRLGVVVALAISLALNSLGLLLVASDRLAPGTFWTALGLMVCIPALVACWIEVRTVRRPAGELRIPSVSLVVSLPTRPAPLESGPAPEDDPRVDQEYLAFRDSLLNRAADRARWFHVTDPLQAVVVEIGGEDSVALLAAYPGGRLRLALTTGESFAGSCGGLPEDVGFAAEHLVEVAGGLRGTLRRELTPCLPDPGHVRIALVTRRRRFAEYVGTATLDDGNQALLATWLAGTQLFETLTRALWPTGGVRPATAREVEPRAGIHAEQTPRSVGGNAAG